MTTHDNTEKQANHPLSRWLACFSYPRILIKPDNETFRVNTMGTCQVIEAAVKLGIRKIILAPSETTYGICFSDGQTNHKVLPLEEDYDVDPIDS